MLLSPILLKTQLSKFLCLINQLEIETGNLTK